MEGIEDLGNGYGWLYNVKPDGVTIESSTVNNQDGARNMKVDAVKAQSSALGRVATGQIDIGTPEVTGLITSVTVSGADQINTTDIPFAFGLSAEDLAADVSEAINNHTSLVDYSATVSGSVITITAPSGSGSTLNGDTIVVSTTAALTYTTVDVDGGSSATELYDEVTGLRFFINADYGGIADPTSLTGAVEITNLLVPRYLNSALDYQELTIAGGLISFERKSAITTISLNTESGLPTDDLDSISPVGFAKYDRVVLIGANPGTVVTVKDSTGNIELQGDKDFVTGDFEEALEVQLIDGVWYEIGRSSQAIGSTAEFRASGYGMFGIESLGTQVAATSGTIQWTAGTDGKIQDITGNVTLVGDLNYEVLSPVDGDEFFVRYDATINTSTFGVTIMNVPLTSEEALNGGFIVYSRYLGSDGWQGFLLPNMDTSKTNPYKVLTDSIKDGAVTVSKVADDLKTELITVPVSWDLNRIGDYKFKMPFACEVKLIDAYLTDTVEGTDDADLDFKDGTLNSMGAETFNSAATIGTGMSTVTPTTNNEFAKGDLMTITSSKATPGGNAIVSIEVLKV